MNPRNRFLQAADDDFPTCPGCNDQVFPRDRPVRALGGQWHPTCLKCTSCKTLLNVRSLESYENKPYCRAHRPTASATQVADDVHIKQATSVPKAADRAAGVDVTAQRKFAAPGRNVRLDAEANRSADRFTNDRKADTGEFTKEALPSATNAGISWADQSHKPDTGEYVREGTASRTQAGYGWGDQSHKADQGEYATTPAVSASSAGTTWADPSHRSDQGEYVKEGFSRQPNAAPAQYSAPPPRSGPPPVQRAAPAAPAPARPPASAPAPPAAAFPPPSPMVAETYESGDQGGYDQSGHEQGGNDHSGYDQGGYAEGGYDQSGEGYDQQYHEGQYHEGGEGYDQQYQEGQYHEGGEGYDQQYQEGQYYEGDEQYQQGHYQ